jgi:hypothetical protein
MKYGTIPLSAYPARSRSTPHVCRFGPPLRKCFQTESGLWADREWEPGERAKYAAEVLGQVQVTPDTLV